MKKLLRNVTLTAAALGAALAVAPKSDADVRVGFGFHPGPRFPAPRFHAPRFYAPHRFYAPARIFRGVRFYSYCPSPGYVYISDGDTAGWVYPPYVGAVWAPGYTNRFGVWIGGRWRR